MELTVNEIFYSIQGEGKRAGFPSVFIRLTGCNLNCVYCDTQYAKTDGNSMQIDSIIQKTIEYKSADHVTVTGGEPLIQENTITLLSRLIELDLDVQIETNGSISLSGIPDKVRKIVDVKTPSSNESGSFNMDNLKLIKDSDEIKFVISDINDYRFSGEFIRNRLIKVNTVINFSPVYNKMSYSELANLILTDRLPVRLNLQLHKIIGIK